MDSVGRNGKTGAVSIRDATFVVVDTETTGTRPDSNRIIEIGAIKVRNGRIIDQFSQLINPGVSIPRFITRLTGISTAMLYSKPSHEEVLPEFLAFLGDSVLVAHNLPFDLRFINAELNRLGRSPLSNATLCTLRLARRLLPGLHSKGLSSVANFFGITFRGRHRALGDAEATAKVFIQFLSRAGFEYEIETVTQLLSFQFCRYGQPTKESHHLRRIRTEILPKIPDRPGVYFMKDGSGKVIYIGKAKSLQNRVRTYFTSIEGHSPRTRKMIEQIRDVVWTETGSELGALLLESRLIKEQQPAFNSALKRYRNRPFIRLDQTETFPRVSWSPFVLNDGAEYFGPVNGRSRAELIIDLINRFFKLRECDDATFSKPGQCIYRSMERCMAPCQGCADIHEYNREVDRVRNFLTGNDRTVLVQLESAMRSAASKLEFEQAALYRDWWLKLDRLMSRQKCIAAPVLEHNAVHILPGTLAATAHLVLVRFGRLVDTLFVGLPLTEEDARKLVARLSHHFRRDQLRPQRYLKKEIDQVHILANWLHNNRDYAQHFHWDLELRIDEFANEVLTYLRSMAYGLAEGTPVEEVTLNAA